VRVVVADLAYISRPSSVRGSWKTRLRMNGKHVIADEGVVDVAESPTVLRSFLRRLILDGALWGFVPIGVADFLVQKLRL